MRFAAAFLLIIVFVLDTLAGAGCLALGLMGAEKLTGMLTGLLSMAGAYAELLQGELEHAVADLLALEARLDFVVAELNARGVSFGHALAAAGGLMVVAGLLALTSGVRLLAQRPGTIVYAGCAAAIIADAAPLALLGFSYLQLPGLIGGLLGMIAMRSLHSGVVTKPAARPVKVARPGGHAEPDLDEEIRAITKVRPTVKTADDFTPKRRLLSLNFRRFALLASVVMVVIVAGLGAYSLYPRYFGQDAVTTKTPPRTTASVPAPAPTLTPAESSAATAPQPAPEPELTVPVGPVKGELAGKPFTPEWVDLKVSTGWTGEGSRNSKKIERLSLVLDAGRDLRIEIEGLAENYDFTKGLELKVSEDSRKPDHPKLILTSPQSGGFPKTRFVSNGYDLDLKLKRLRGNRVSGHISLSLPSYMKTELAGTFKAWVDGHPDIEPDLTRGGRQTFKYLAFQYLKDFHAGAKISIKDDTYSHQVGNASGVLRGHIMVVYTVDGADTAMILRISTSEGYWRVLDTLDATYLAEAHPIEIPDPSNEGQWVNYLAAKHTEEWFREKYPGKYPWTVIFTGTSNTEIGYADIQLRLQPYGESDAIKRRYYFLRTAGKWRYIRDLREEERIDASTGQVLRTANAS